MGESASKNDLAGDAARSPPGVMQDPDLFLYAVCEFFDNGIGEDFAGNALNLRPRGLLIEIICKRQSEILALADSRDVCESDLSKCVVDGLALRIEDGSLQRNVDMRLHYPRL
jgi:hypothetical protein